MLLRRAIEADRLGSLVFAGPPGSGKTTLARVIAGTTHAEFESLNAVFAGVKDIREVVARAKERLETGLAGSQRTMLFVDEVHRFNKAQQDALLPHVENGTLTFVGATTENPYFEVNKALVSRSRVFELRPLSDDEVGEVLRAALADSDRGYGSRSVELASDALRHLALMAQGDARNALNALELAVETTPENEAGVIEVTLAVAEESIQRRALLYDKDGDAHYDMVSAFIKSLRGSDPDAALYWMARMLAAGEDPRFIARRLVIFASEDVGLADPGALAVATGAAHAVEYVGMPECQWSLSQASLYLALAPKSNSTAGYFAARRAVEEGASDEVPNHLKDPSRDRHGLGHGKGYRYPHAFREHWVPQQYLPGELQGARFYEPGRIGRERELADGLDGRRERQGVALPAAARLDAERDRVERAMRDLASEFGKGAVELAGELARSIALDRADRVLVLGRERLLAWALAAENPLVKIYGTQSEMEEAKAQRSRLAREGVDRLVRYVVDRTGTQCFRAAGIDAVAGWRLVGARSDRVRVCAELARILAPGGELALAERSTESDDLERVVRENGAFESVEVHKKGGALLLWARKSE